MAETKEKAKPAVTYRVGDLSCSVFARDVESNGNRWVAYDVSVRRFYVAQGTGERKYTPSLRHEDFENAKRLLDRARAYIESQ